ncbi:MAG: PilW family protein [Chromatiales bacterium]|jgi:type IV pilus assembly protein PilW|nr:PilW family protein [Chromatiales bacterium]
MNGPSPATCRGLTLVELLVSMAVGLLLATGLGYTYLQAAAGRDGTESLTDLQETAQFAVDAVEADLRLAGFYGRGAGAARLTVLPGIAIRCDGSDVTPWVLDLAHPVAGHDEAWDLPCRARWNSPRAGSDVLVVRHASPAAASPTAGQVQVSARPDGSRLGSDGSAAAPPASLHDLEVRAYYVNDRSSFDGSRPSLRQLTLTRNGTTPTLEDEEVVAGIENLQVLFGLDADSDGSVERYASPAEAALADPADIVAVRLWLLASAPAGTAGFHDDRSHVLPDGSRAITGGDAGYPVDARRIAITRTIALENRLP